MQGQEMTKELLEQQKQTFAPWMVQLKQTLPEDQYDLVDRVLEYQKHMNLQKISTKTN